MHNETTSTNASALACESASVRRAELATALRHDLTSYNGSAICFGIMLAGAAYPLVVAFVLIVFLVAQIIWRMNQRSFGPGLPDLAVIPFFLAGYAVLGAMLGIIWAGILSMITLPVVLALVRSLKLCGSLVSLGAVSGGLVGFIAALPVTMSLPWAINASDLWALLVMLPLGPGLATILGQIGGAWGGWKAMQQLANYYGIVETSNSGHSGDVASEVLTTLNEQEAATPQRKWQFGMRHVLWLVVWISVLLSVIRLSGIPFEYVIPLVAGWIVYQWLTLRVGRQIVGWLGPKWAARRSLRST